MRFSDELTGERPNPELAKILTVSLAAVPLSLATTLLPRDRPVMWGWVGVAVAISVLITVKFAADGMFSRSLKRPIPGWQMAVALTSFTGAAGIAVFAGSGPLGVYRPLLAILLVWWAMWGDRSMLAYGTAVSVAALGVATYQQDVPARFVLTLMVEYGYCWAVTAAAIFMLVAQINSARDASQRLRSNAEVLADLSAVAARSRHLDPALDHCLALVAQLITAEHLAVVAVGPSGGSVAQLASSNSDALGRVIDEDDLREAALAGVPKLSPSSSLVPIGEFDGDALVLHIAGCEEIERDHDEGTLDSVVTVLSNMVERVAFVQRLEALTRTDPLTGIANRSALTDTLTHELAVAQRTGAPLSVAMIDLDHFKAYNDTYGHLAGDGALRAVAGTLAARCRAADTAARYGGEEFCLCLPDTGLDRAAQLVDELLTSVRALRADAPISFSAGVAAWDGHEPAAALLDRADRALYDAKANGRDRVEVADIQASA